MRTLVLIGASVLVILILAANAVTASAAVELLPGAAKTPFTGISGEVDLQIKGGPAIKCTKSEIKAGNAELLSKTTLLLIVDMTGCKSLGLAAKSTGDPSETILAHFEAELCTVQTKPLFGGILFKPLPLTIEVPTGNITYVIDGDFVGFLEPENKMAKEFPLDIKQAAGVQAIEGCLNAGGTQVVPETLLTSTNGGVFLTTGIEVKTGKFVFTTTQEFMT
jgi:hypothetical protein